MTLKQLPVGKKFNIVRENDPSIVYVKINELSHGNVTYEGKRMTLHGCTTVVEVK